MTGLGVLGLTSSAPGSKQGSQPLVCINKMQQVCFKLLKSIREENLSKSANHHSYLGFSITMCKFQVFHDSNNLHILMVTSILMVYIY